MPTDNWLDMTISHESRTHVQCQCAIVYVLPSESDNWSDMTISHESRTTQYASLMSMRNCLCTESLWRGTYAVADELVWESCPIYNFVNFCSFFGPSRTTFYWIEMLRHFLLIFFSFLLHILELYFSLIFCSFFAPLYCIFLNYIFPSLFAHF